jgi:hypothetical protein
VLSTTIPRIHRKQYVPSIIYAFIVIYLTDLGESQKAFNVLQKRLKPLEHYQPIPYDFYNLAYLTSAGSVHDAPGLKEWSGEALEREKLVGMWREMMKSVVAEIPERDARRGGKGRLEVLLRQAGAWQVMKARRRGDGPWTLHSLVWWSQGGADEQVDGWFSTAYYTLDIEDADRGAYSQYQMYRYPRSRLQSSNQRF